MARRSHTSIIIIIYNELIIWFSKKQNTVKAATFGSKLVAPIICKDFIVVFRYKLWVFVVRLEGPAFFFVIIMELLRT